MPPKRPLPDAEASSSSRKEQRITQRRDARKISTQVASQPLDRKAASEAFEKARRPGVSLPIQTLPPQLDAEQAIAARKFEVTALRKAIKSARASSSTRAWQLLPRHARRRAASHNVLRLPARLRAKGLAELRASVTTAKTRSQIRKRLPNHPLGKAKARRDDLRRRAVTEDKRWLETHMWHSKRFRMSRQEFDGDRWGWALPEEPSMKGERTDWRAATTKCALYDASYDQWVRLSVKIVKVPRLQAEVSPGAQIVGSSTAQEYTSPSSQALSVLQQVISLARIQEAGSGVDISFLAGEATETRAYHAVLHGGNEATSSDCALCPVTLFLIAANPSVSSIPVRASITRGQGAGSTSRPMHRITSLLPKPPPQSRIWPDAEVLVRVHPAGIESVQNALQKAVKQHTTKKHEYHRCRFVVERLLPTAATGLVTDERAQRKELSTEGFGSTSKAAGRSSTQLAGCIDAPLSLAGLTRLEQQLERRLAGLRRADLRSRAFNTFELYGPLSGLVLGKILRPVRSTDASTQEAWRAVTAPHPGSRRCALDSSKIASAGAKAGDAGGHVKCIEMRVHDPRISLPATPARRKGKGQSRKSASSRKTVNASSGTSAIDSKGLGATKESSRCNNNEGRDRPAVQEAHGDRRLLHDGYPSPRFTKGSIDARRSQLLLPGSRLEPTSRDDIVPVVIVPHAAQDTGSVLEGYSLIVPQCWGRAFFHCLVSMGTTVRPIGLSGQRSLYREAGRPSYPMDWPSASAIVVHRSAQASNKDVKPAARTAWEVAEEFSAAKQREAWARRPPAKRINYTKLGVQWPFGSLSMWRALCERARAAMLFRLRRDSWPDDDSAAAEGDRLDTAGLHLVGSYQLLEAEARWLALVPLWQTRTIESDDVSESVTTKSTRQIEHCIVKRACQLLAHIPRSTEPSHPMVIVQLDAVGRATLQEGDEIRLPTVADEAGRMLGVRADSSEVVGSVMRGGFSLSRGHSHGLGLMAAKAWGLAAAMDTQQARHVQAVRDLEQIQRRAQQAFSGYDATQGLNASMSSLNKATNLLNMSKRFDLEGFRGDDVSLGQSRRKAPEIDVLVRSIRSDAPKRRVRARLVRV